MGILDIFRKKKVVKARYDAAQTTRDNAAHWAMADYLSPDLDAAPNVRKTLRTRSRYEVSNNSYAKGLVQNLANDTVGTGPRLQVASDDAVERAFARWAKAVDLAPKLRTMRMARCQDGEAFALLYSNPRLDGVRLDIQLIEADRVTQDNLWTVADGEVDGIKFDDYGNPVSYHILKYHPGDPRGTANNFFEVGAERVIHIFRQDRPEQHRGIPELTAALPLFAQLRRYNLAALSAAEAAADFAAILYTDAPPDGEAESVEPMDNISLERNMMLTVPAGWKMSQLDPKQPTANHAEFVKVILSEIARCVAATYGNVSGDYSAYNYSSGRLDNQLYYKSITVDRTLWESKVLDRIFSAWYKEYSLLNGIPGTEPDHEWHWDAFQHVDPVKEAQAQALRIANHTTTLAAECAREGRDYETVLRQAAKEKELMNELGLNSETPKIEEDNKNED